MVLTWLIVIPAVGGVAAWLIGRDAPSRARVVALASCLLQLALTCALWAMGDPAGHPSQPIAEQSAEWIPRFGISYHLALDGLSLLLILLTGLLGVVAVAASWQEITRAAGAFHFALLAVLAGVTGVFLARDLLLFYVFWEVMLIPMYFLIAVWGHEGRRAAAVRFFLFTFVSSVFMLAAILGLAFIHQRESGVLTFDAAALAGTRLSTTAGMLLMLGFFLAFATKLPAVPLHTWLADAHTEAPTGGSVILAGLLLKTGAYGLLRFVLPLFPEATATFAPTAQVIGAISILYGGLLALAQNDVKRVIAYSSISHMGFVLLGIFTDSEIARHGAVIQIIAHGLSTPALFFLAGSIQQRCHTRDVEQLGGLWQLTPRLGGFMLFFALATLALPGTANFNGEFLVLLGAFQAWPLLGAVAAAGLILSVLYSLRLVQEVIHGPNTHGWQIADLTGREIVTLAALVVLVIGAGLYPRPIVRAASFSLSLDRSLSVVAREPAAEIPRGVAEQ